MCVYALWRGYQLRAGDSTLAFARRKSPGMRHRFSPLFISPLRAVTMSRGRNAISENRVVPRLFRPFHQARNPPPRLRAIRQQPDTKSASTGPRAFETGITLQIPCRHPITNSQNGHRTCHNRGNSKKAIILRNPIRSPYQAHDKSN